VYAYERDLNRLKIYLFIIQFLFKIHEGDQGTRRTSLIMQTIDKIGMIIRDSRIYTKCTVVMLFCNYQNSIIRIFARLGKMFIPYA